MLWPTTIPLVSPVVRVTVVLLLLSVAVTAFEAAAAVPSENPLAISSSDNAKAEFRLRPFRLSRNPAVLPQTAPLPQSMVSLLSPAAKPPENYAVLAPAAVNRNWLAPVPTVRLNVPDICTTPPSSTRLEAVDRLPVPKPSTPSLTVVRPE
jgi:hypothetical protein